MEKKIRFICENAARVVRACGRSIRTVPTPIWGAAALAVVLRERSPVHLRKRRRAIERASANNVRRRLPLIPWPVMGAPIEAATSAPIGRSPPGAAVTGE